MSLVLGEETIRDLFPILQQGFGVRATVPCTIRELLCDQMGLDHEYVSERITTIFLNGKPTDSMEEMVADDSTLALSAAMPGVVGATMRRGSYYAAMRSDITCTGEENTVAAREGLIWIKLFNLLLDDLGPNILTGGIIITPRILQDFLLHAPVRFLENCGGVFIDGQSVAPGFLKESISYAPDDLIELYISS